MAVNWPKYELFIEKCLVFVCMIKAKLNAYINTNGLQFEKSQYSYIINCLNTCKILGYNWTNKLNNIILKYQQLSSFPQELLNFIKRNNCKA